MPPDSNKDDGMYQFMDNYNKWDKSPNTFSVNDMESSHTFTAVDTNDSTNGSIKSDFWIGEVNHKYGMFKANYYHLILDGTSPSI